MRYHDIGRRDGAMILFGGPYSNVQALVALKEAAKARGIAAEHMVGTGDVVAYAADARDCCAQMQALDCPVIAGNCEVQLGSGADNCGCGFEEGTPCDLLSAGWFAHASAEITDADRVWMQSLPRFATFVHQGARYGVLHGGVTDIARFIWSTSEDAVFAEEWAALEAITGPVDHIIAGHSGIPFIRETERGRWINAGVIGMPPHDGGQQTRFAVLDRGEVQMQRLTYDAQAAADAMDAAGLAAGYRKGLTSGYWPSEDVLPAALRAPSFASG